MSKKPKLRLGIWLAYEDNGIMKIYEEKPRPVTYKTGGFWRNADCFTEWAETWLMKSSLPRPREHWLENRWQLGKDGWIWKPWRDGE